MLGFGVMQGARKGYLTGNEVRAVMGFHGISLACLCWLLPDFRLLAVQVNLDYAASQHHDVGNEGLPLVVARGQYVGGVCLGRGAWRPDAGTGRLWAGWQAVGCQEAVCVRWAPFARCCALCGLAGQHCVFLYDRPDRAAGCGGATPSAWPTS